MIQICGGNRRAAEKGPCVSKIRGIVAPCQQITFASGSGVFGPDQRPCFDGKGYGPGVRGEPIGLHCFHAIPITTVCIITQGPGSLYVQKRQILFRCYYIMCNSRWPTGWCPQTLTRFILPSICFQQITATNAPLPPNLTKVNQLSKLHPSSLEIV